MNEFALFLLENNVTDSVRLRNKFRYRVIESECSKKLSPLFSAITLMMAATGVRVGDVLNIKAGDIDCGNGRVVIKPLKENRISDSLFVYHFLESVRLARKTAAFDTGDFYLYANTDRMPVEDIRLDLTLDELKLFKNRRLELKSEVISRFIPTCLLKKISPFIAGVGSDGFIFRSELTGANRCMQISGKSVSRQSVWKNIRSLKTYQNGDIGNPLTMREPLIF